MHNMLMLGNEVISRLERERLSAAGNTAENCNERTGSGRNVSRTRPDCKETAGIGRRLNSRQLLPNWTASGTAAGKQEKSGGGLAGQSGSGREYYGV